MLYRAATTVVKVGNEGLGCGNRYPRCHGTVVALYGVRV